MYDGRCFGLVELLDQIVCCENKNSYSYIEHGGYSSHNMNHGSLRSSPVPLNMHVLLEYISACSVRTLGSFSGPTDAADDGAKGVGDVRSAVSLSSRFRKDFNNQLLSTSI